jgi:hypothetical protein
MASTAQINANRQNAQHSCGPKTPEGKAASSANATRHGLSSAAFTVLPHENQDEYNQLLAAYRDEFHPQGVHQDFLVEQMAQHRFKLTRIHRLEQSAFEQILTEPNANDDSPDGRILAALGASGNVLDKLQRYAAASERAYYRAHRELEQARARSQKSEAAALDNYLKKITCSPVPLDLGAAASEFLQNEPNFDRLVEASRPLAARTAPAGGQN